MNIQQKMKIDTAKSLFEHGPITIVALGDSVTHGALTIADGMDYETVYWNRLRKKMVSLADFVPINVINAGICGDTAYEALKRLDSQVLKHEPDLVIVCFGLNDINNPVEEYQTGLRGIFERCEAAGAQVIYMTPNMLNTRVAEDVEECYREYAAVTADIQNNGTMDKYMDAGRQVAKEMGVPICDCYAMWKEKSKTEDITMMLANRINHPSREMHELFADSLFRMLFPEEFSASGNTNNTMYVDRED